MYFILILLWIIFNGRFTLEILLIGMGISFLIYIFMIKFLDYNIRTEIHVLKNIFRLIFYFMILVKEIVKANFDTVKVIFSVEYQIEPVIIRFRPELRTEMARLLLASSITLTPGTITVMMQEGEFMVHCLDRSLGEGIENSRFVEMLKKMESTVLKEE